MPKTLFDKIWEAHMVKAETTDYPGVLYIDRQLIHEVTSPQAFAMLEEKGIPVRRPELTIATMDHGTPTLRPDEEGNYPFVDDSARKQCAMLETNCEKHGVTLYALGSRQQGIVHVIGPELGLTLPGQTIVCGDSHTSTHGAFGALAFGIGTSEVGHVMATQCLLQRKPKTIAINVEGQLQPGVTAKDLIMGIIAQVGIGGGTGAVFEYRGEAVKALTMDERMTVCNMSIEAGARAGLIAPDDKTFAYIKGRQYAPKGEDWDKAVARWRTLPTDEGAVFDKEISVDVSKLEPMVTYGTNPGMAIGIGAPIPDPKGSATEEHALNYMGLKTGESLLGQHVDMVFIGSCTNSRISDLRAAAAIFKDRKVASGVRTLVVPGSFEVKDQAEKEGLDQIFLAAGAEWREPGCSMCIAMNGDLAQPGELVVSTSNRNFLGRQGAGSKTVLASPLTAAASAINGVVSDARQLGGN